jgi:hypothetical protein
VWASVASPPRSGEILRSVAEKFTTTSTKKPRGSMSAHYRHRSSVLIFCVLVWYATIAIFTFPWALLMLELAFGVLLWRNQARGVSSPGGRKKPRHRDEDDDTNVVTNMGKAC